LGVTICEVGFKQEVVGCGERGFEFVKEAVMPYSIEGLLNVNILLCRSTVLISAILKSCLEFSLISQSHYSKATMLPLTRLRILL
jgi:hypothetical protein